MKIKDTLHFGKTDFQMWGGLPTNEPIRQAKWYTDNLYQKRLDLNKAKPHFNLHDGPPFANGNIHIGHALNKITKDIIVRYKNMNGFYAPFVPGWDTHGLPIEQQLTKAGHKRKEKSISDWRKLSLEFATKQVEIQKQDFKRLGIMADWDNPYITYQPEFEAQEIRVFKAMVEKGLIYRGSKPVYWSWSSESALAESEIEYHDLESQTAYYGNKVIDGNGVLENGTNLVVWTTTPWTVPGSRGISVGPDFEYSVVLVGEQKYVVASTLLEDLATEFEWSKYSIEKTVTGKEMDKITVQHPYLPDIKLLVMNGDHVTLDSGTGLVHTAPGFGEDDYNIGIKYGIEVAAPVDNQGKLTEEAGTDFNGVFYQDADEISINKLKDAGLLLKVRKVNHSYPFDWRTKKPIIWRAVPQWFASVDKIRTNILEEINKVDFTPDWGQKRLHNMISDRGDWVISRQRAWGVPLPIFYNEDGSAILDPDVIEHVAQLFAKNGSNYWFEHSAKELLPEGYTNLASPNGEFEKENDIMDVWFDSGSSWNGVLNTRLELSYPADLYLEGSDQYRGWFNSSLITSVASNGISPYKQILSQGFVLDGKGEKMSKSIGNTIEPNEVAKKKGIEIVRLWVLSADTSQDVRVSNELLQQVSENYRKIRNTVRFLLANTNDFNPSENSISEDKLLPIDNYMNEKFKKFVSEWIAKFDRYNFKDAFQQLVNFINVDLSAFYLDIAKDVVYIEAKNSFERRSMQTVFYKILLQLTQLLTPVLPHTSEEIYENMQYEKSEYVYLTEMPKAEKYNQALIDQWGVIFKIRDAINKELEVARQNELIGKNAEAKLVVSFTNEQQKLIDFLKLDLRKIMMVSQLEVNTDKNDFSVLVQKAEGKLDPRDRLFHNDIGADSAYPLLSKKNAEILRIDYPETISEELEE
jgi:isoleucyl-tRNA synthetase